MPFDDDDPFGRDAFGRDRFGRDDDPFDDGWTRRSPDGRGPSGPLGWLVSAVGVLVVLGMMLGSGGPGPVGDGFAGPAGFREFEAGPVGPAVEFEPLPPREFRYRDLDLDVFATASAAEVVAALPDPAGVWPDGDWFRTEAADVRVARLRHGATSLVAVGVPTAIEVDGQSRDVVSAADVEAALAAGVVTRVAFGPQQVDVPTDATDVAVTVHDVVDGPLVVLHAVHEVEDVGEAVRIAADEWRSAAEHAAETRLR